MGNSKLEQALDILDKFDFFNQRAGRELWLDKPKNIQDEDIKNFESDVEFLRNFIKVQQEELECVKMEYAGYKAGTEQFAKDRKEIINQTIWMFAAEISKKFSQLEYAPRVDRKTLRIEEVTASVNTLLQVGVSQIVNKLADELVGETE